MKTFIHIYKTMLLWATGISILMFLMGMESMIEQSRWTLILVWLVINILFYWMCRQQLTYRDFYKLSGTQWFENLLRKSK